MQNISGFGLTGNLVASNTFPQGFPITAFADDTDPLDNPDLQVADSAMGLNGDFIVWNKPNGIEIVIAVIPRSTEDTNLGLLLDANRVAKGKTSAKDQVTLTVTYPDGMIATLSEGIIEAGQPTQQVASAGRLKSRTYRFKFAKIAKAAQ
jgi:hypothetical protein